jgi:hypothetical protein
MIAKCQPAFSARAVTVTQYVARMKTTILSLALKYDKYRAKMVDICKSNWLPYHLSPLLAITCLYFSSLEHYNNIFSRLGIRIGWHFLTSQTTYTFKCPIIAHGLFDLLPPCLSKCFYVIGLRAGRKTRNSLARSTRSLIARLVLDSFHNKPTRFKTSWLDF